MVAGCDRVANNGDTANKIGTYSLAVLAKYHGYLIKCIHKRMAYTAFWTKVPPGRKKNIPKETACNGLKAKFEHSY